MDSGPNANTQAERLLLLHRAMVTYEQLMDPAKPFAKAIPLEVGQWLYKRRG